VSGSILERWVPAYIGIGSNLQNPIEQIARGFAGLNDLPSSRLVARSPLYRSAPIGPQHQPDFINAAAGLLTQLAPEQLLHELKRLERELGRAQPVERWGPRLIDFDLLVYGDLRLASAQLTIPHAGIPERAFVVYPLRDIAPDLEIPGIANLVELERRVAQSGIEKI
jgi:2-amino-4-hydroxy-6-hydroxymethyldihydropteridine diphosphokinase